mgnify:CR=1 FL=1
MTRIGGVSASVVAGRDLHAAGALLAATSTPHPLQTIFICLAGGCLGVFFLIPLRRYFVRETHGAVSRTPRRPRSPRSSSPGRRAARRPSCSSRRPSSPAVYDFFVTTFHVWKEFVDFQFVPLVKDARRQGQGRLPVRRDRVHPGPGLRHGPALVDDPVRGGVLSNFVLVPLDLLPSARTFPDVVPPGTKAISAMTRERDLPRVRPVHRRRRDRHGGDLRHPQVARSRRGLVRHRDQGRSVTVRGTSSSSAPTATSPIMTMLVGDDRHVGPRAASSSARSAPGLERRSASASS